MTLRAWAPALLSALALYGQSNLATVTGVVTDTAQAVMPAVAITIRNVETNSTRSMQTNQEGYFTITNLPPGHYELVAEKSGFRTYRETGIVLEVGQEIRIPVMLTVGDVTRTVSVTADIELLNTENGSIKGDVIPQTEIEEMPLNGRDFTELALLVPGVTKNAQGGAGSFASINGARADNTNFVVDGFNDRNVRGAAAQFRPNIDAMQEFKMEVSGFSAEYGKMAGGILNMVIRSGTNQYHGSLFEYFRNDFFDAKSYFSTDRLGLHQNQFGGTVLGPLSIPKVYNGHDRTFYLFSVESYRLVWGQNKLGNVPTTLEQAGNFTQTRDVQGKSVAVKNPFAGNAPFPGDAIPASLFNPVALKLLPFYPLPNRSAVGNNYLATANNVNDWDSFLGKVDERFSNSDSMSFRYGKRFGRSNAPWAGTNLGTFGNHVRDDRSLGGIDYTHMFSPTLLMEARFGLSRNASREHILDHGYPNAAGLGMQGSTNDPVLTGFPLINVTGYLPLGFAANEPVQYFVTGWQWGDKFTWVKDKHNLKWGFDLTRSQFNQPYFNNSRGTMTLNGTAWTGNAIGDVELGLIANSTITAQTARNYMRLTDYGFFVNDDWKITRSLTLNLGLRYEIDKPPVDKYDRTSNFIPSLNKIVVASEKNIPNFSQEVARANLTNIMAVASDYGLPRSLVYPNYHGIAPRLGFAWRPLNRTVLRGGYGIFNAGQILNDLRNGLDNTFPMVILQQFAHAANNPNLLTLANPWPQAIATLAGTTTSTGYELRPADSYLQSYNLTVEREIGRGVAVEVGFVGSKGTHLGREYNLNLPFRTIPNYMAFGNNFPVPYPPLGTINFWDYNSNSIYNAGQIKLRRRANGGFFYQFSYSYSKSIDSASQVNGASTGGFTGALDPRNLGLERARSDWDRGHIVQAFLSWPLPVGRGQKWFKGSGKVTNGFIGGWQLSGTSVFETGPPLTVEVNGINANIGESTRPNRVAPGKDPTGAGRHGVDFPWYNPSAFVGVPNCASRTNCSPDQYGFLPFAPGNSGRGILDGPGLQNINLSLFKNWPIGEGRKRIQFRWEVFNIFNHPNFLLPDRFYNETAAGYLNDVQASGNGGPRIMQFALRYDF